MWFKFLEAVSLWHSGLCTRKCYDRKDVAFGLPWWSLVKNLPSNAGDTDSIPGQGTKIPPAAGQLSPCTTTREACVMQWRPCTAKTNKQNRCGFNDHKKLFYGNQVASLRNINLKGSHGISLVVQPDSSVYVVLQATILQWVAVPSFRGSSWPRDQTHISSVSCISRWVLYY